MCSAVSSRYEIVYPVSPYVHSLRDRFTLPDVTGLELIGNVDSAKVYAGTALLAEIESIRNLGGLANTHYSHATSSAALPGIARHGAILSSTELIARGEEVVTGEYTTEAGERHRHTGGLKEVYVSSGLAGTLYSVVVGDEFPVIFGLSKQVLAGRPPHSLYDEGDGIWAGNKVSLEHVASVAVPFENLPEIREWTGANCKPGTPAVSLDVAFLFGYLGWQGKK